MTVSLEAPAGSSVASPPWSEGDRVAALCGYDILDTPTEPDFDDVARLAAETLDAPIAVVNLVAGDRQWFKAEVGIGARELPLDVSLCAHAILQNDFMVVPDTRADARFTRNPLVTADNGLRFYAGALLRTPEGLPIGTLCVLDRAPRPEGVTAHQRLTLEVLARQVMTQLELRRAVADRDGRVTAILAERDRAWSLSQDLLAVAESNGTLTVVNAAWTDHLGWSEAELVGRKFTELTHPDDLENTMRAFAGIFEAPLVEPYEYRLRHLNGSYRWFAWTGAFENGHVYANGRAVSAERDQREALRATEEALRQSQKMEAIGQLTGGVAHDFNNLLTVIRSATDLLRLHDLSEDKRRRYVDAISDTADRAAKLTGQLLAFARRQALKAETFDACDAVRTIETMLRTLVGSRIRLSITSTDDLCSVSADRSQFETAIVNIVVNARDAMNSEGALLIDVSKTFVIPAIRAHPAVEGQFVAVSIVDNGEGISRDNLGRIFEPFFTTKAVGQGTGLGLSQVFGFAKQSGGDVLVESNPGRGTTFTLYLPWVVDKRESDDDGTENVLLPESHATCVLVVEDNADVGQFATQSLIELGYHTVHAPDAERALAELDKDPGRFHVVFSDIMMPGMSGVELGQEIRRRYPDLPVLLTSGYSHILAQNGSFGFELLHKPYSVEQLSRMLRKAIGRRRSCQLS